MNEFLTLSLGAVVGLLFGLCKLPIPAPPSIAGVLGIIGIFIGFWLAGKIIG